MTKPHDGQLRDRLYQTVKVEGPIEFDRVRLFCRDVPIGQLASMLSEMVRAGALECDVGKWPRLFYSISSRSNAMQNNGTYLIYMLALGDVKPDVVGLDDKGNPHRLLTRERAAELLRDKQGIEIEHPKRAGGTTTAEALKRQSEEEMKRKARAAAIEEISAEVARWFGDKYFKDRMDADVLMQVLGRSVLQVAGAPYAFAVLKRRSDNGSTQIEAASKLLTEGADAAGVIELLAEVCVRSELSRWVHGWEERSKSPICDFAGLDCEGFEKRALKALKDGEKPKAKSKKPSKESV